MFLYEGSVSLYMATLKFIHIHRTIFQFPIFVSRLPCDGAKIFNRTFENLL